MVVLREIEPEKWVSMRGWASHVWVLLLNSLHCSSWYHWSDFYSPLVAASVWNLTGIEEKRSLQENGGLTAWPQKVDQWYKVHYCNLCIWVVPTCRRTHNRVTTPHSCVPETHVRISRKRNGTLLRYLSPQPSPDPFLPRFEWESANRGPASN